MGNTVSTRRIEFETGSWPLDSRPYLIVERRGCTLYYGPSFAEADMALRYVERVEPYTKRVGVERGEASWVGQAVELCNPGSGCLRQEKDKNPQNFVYNPPEFRAPNDTPQRHLGKSLGLLTPAESSAHWAAKNERIRVNYERQQAQERAWEIAQGLRTT